MGVGLQKEHLEEHGEVVWSCSFSYWSQCWDWERDSEAIGAERNDSLWSCEEYTENRGQFGETCDHVINRKLKGIVCRVGR